MALIGCVECGKQVSSLAIACPSCGCPISEGTLTKGTPSAPALPSDLHVFTTVSLWSLCPGIFWGRLSANSDLPGIDLGVSATIDRFEEGIGVSAGGRSLKIHYSQMASVQFTKAVSVKEKSKSVLGRAAVGLSLIHI